jgi:hypothetical protein
MIPGTTGLNRYEYLGNDPMGGTDPLGLFDLKQVAIGTVNLAVGVGLWSAGVALTPGPLAPLGALFVTAGTVQIAMGATQFGVGLAADPGAISVPGTIIETVVPKPSFKWRQVDFLIGVLLPGGQGRILHPLNEILNGWSSIASIWDSWNELQRRLRHGPCPWFVD